MLNYLAPLLPAASFSASVSQAKKLIAAKAPQKNTLARTKIVDIYIFLGQEALFLAVFLEQAGPEKFQSDQAE